MDSLSNKVLITGINGFTGKYLKEYLLENNYAVFGLSNNESEDDDAATFKCDINNKEEVVAVLKEIEPNYIIHLAAISFVQHADLSEMYNVNVLGTQNLLDACVECKASLKKVILASSATVYGNQVQEVLNENLCPNPVNHYGISKLAMEFMAKNYFKELPILITRPFNYTAPGHAEHFVIPKIAKAFRDKEAVLELGNIDVYREYNSIQYVCEVYLELMKSQAVGQTVNIASGKTHSLNDILDIFSKKSGHNLEVRINPSFVRKDEIKTLSGGIEKLASMITIPKENSIDAIVESFLA